MKVLIILVTLMLVLPNYTVVNVKPINTSNTLKLTGDLYGDIVVWQEVNMSIIKSDRVTGIEVDEATDIVIHNLSTSEEWKIDEPGAQNVPRIYKDKIAYFDWTNRTRANLMLYDINTRRSDVLVNNLVLPGDMDIFEDRIVYAEGSKPKMEIWLYNITTGENTLIASDKEKDCFKPRIYGDNIIYTKATVIKIPVEQVKEPSLMLYNISTKEEKEISKAYYIGGETIYKNNIAWCERPVENESRIMLYNITSGEKRRVPLQWNTFVEVSLYENILVFTGYVGRDSFGIGGLDILNSQYFPISVLENAIVGFQLHIHGKRVIWTDYRNSPEPLNLHILQPNEIWSAEIRR
jgi:hypothetical protein